MVSPMHKTHADFVSSLVRNWPQKVLWTIKIHKTRKRFSKSTCQIEIISKFSSEMYIKQKILSLSFFFFFFGWELMSDSRHEQPRRKKVRQEREGVKGCFQASCDCGQLKSVWMRKSGRQNPAWRFLLTEPKQLENFPPTLYVSMAESSSSARAVLAELFAEATRKEERLGAAWQMLSISSLCL